MAQNFNAINRFSESLHFQKIQLRAILDTAPSGNRCSLLNRSRIVSNENGRLPTNKRPSSASIQCKINDRIASGSVDLCLDQDDAGL
jgi:hypothetical protein